MITRLRQLIRFWRLYNVHRLSAERIRGWQSECLRILIEHATQNVPFYQELYAAEGISADQIRSVDDIARLPLTRKEMYRTRPADELVRSDKPHRSVWKKTSGSSGHPLTILMSNILQHPFYSDFVCYRFLVEDRPITPWAFNPYRVLHINVRAKPHKRHLFITMTEFEKNMDAVIERINAFKPDVIASYTSVLLTLARRLMDNPELLPHRPRFASCFGEMITPAVRAEIEKGIGCELFDRYGGTEMGAIASECRMHDGMHVHSESVIIEILDEHGNPAAPGQFGRIVLTDLLNFNMPFIRYEIGDSGALIDEPCACGLKTPRLRLEGRYSAYLTFGNNRVNHLEFDGALDSLMNAVLQYRVVKESDSSIVIQIIPGSLYTEETEKTIRSRITQLVPSGTSVSVSLVDSLPRTGRGKSQIIADLTAA